MATDAERDEEYRLEEKIERTYPGRYDNPDEYPEED